VARLLIQNSKPTIIAVFLIQSSRLNAQLNDEGGTNQRLCGHSGRINQVKGLG
jgi:hypothetical protein